MATTQFPPVTYSSSFVSYLIQAANDTSNDIVEDNGIDEVAKNNFSVSNNSSVKIANQVSPARLRWKQLAKIIRDLHKSSSPSPQNHQEIVMTNGHSHPEEPHSDNSDEDSSDSLESKDLTLLEILALKSLELTAPASDILLKNRSNNWVQLSGHEDSFALAGPGTIWKRRANDDIEVRAYQALMKDEMCSDMVPKFYRDVKYKGDCFIEMQDLLYQFKDASIMDIKMGTRTFLESEVQNTKARRDLYDKMIAIDQNAPTPEEHKLKAVTKLRYMQFREQLSSSSNLGFRIEGFTTGNSQVTTKELKLVKTLEEVKKCLLLFLLPNDEVRLKLIERLKQMMYKFENSKFFQTHEVIGSSLLIIHNNKDVGVWMIDFAKTVPLNGTSIDHRSSWVLGNHEDGYLFGLQHLIDILEEND